jgi:hypothetical protein
LHDKLALESDIYSYAFFKFIHDHNPILLGELMLKCFMTIMVQFALIYFKYTETKKKELAVYPGTPTLNGVRIICTLIMHLYMYPEIATSIQMLQFSIY